MIGALNIGKNGKKSVSNFHYDQTRKNLKFFSPSFPVPLALANNLDYTGTHIERREMGIRDAGAIWK